MINKIITILLKGSCIFIVLIALITVTTSVCFSGGYIDFGSVYNGMKQTNDMINILQQPAREQRAREAEERRLKVEEEMLEIEREKLELIKEQQRHYEEDRIRKEEAYKKQIELQKQLDEQKKREDNLRKAAFLSSKTNLENHDNTSRSKSSIERKISHLGFKKKISTAEGDVYINLSKTTYDGHFIEAVYLVLYNTVNGFYFDKREIKPYLIEFTELIDTHAKTSSTKSVIGYNRKGKMLSKVEKKDIYSEFVKYNEDSIFSDIASLFEHKKVSTNHDISELNEKLLPNGYNIKIYDDNKNKYYVNLDLSSKYKDIIVVYYVSTTELDKYKTRATPDYIIYKESIDTDNMTTTIMDVKGFNSNGYLLWEFSSRELGSSYSYSKQSVQQAVVNMFQTLPNLL